MLIEFKLAIASVSTFAVLYLIDIATKFRFEYLFDYAYIFLVLIALSAGLAGLWRL